MSTRSRPPPSDLGDDDEKTIVDEPASWEGVITPVEIPRCVECGAIVFEDDFSDMARAIGTDRCMRSKPDAERPWHWCTGYSPTHDKFVELVPKKR